MAQQIVSTPVETARREMWSAARALAGAVLDPAITEPVVTERARRVLVADRNLTAAVATHSAEVLEGLRRLLSEGIETGVSS